MNNDLTTSYGVFKNGKIYCPNCSRLIVNPVIIRLDNGKPVTLCYCGNYIIVEDNKWR